ncbi:radical SAM protein [Candidatus Woesearchaeota archaeon]|nr:radical SAM protein [Candidatus Woesearchaeota archaeon]
MEQLVSNMTIGKKDNFITKKLNIALVHPVNKEKNYAMNKDLNGGFGTADDYGNSFTSRIIRLIKKRSIRLPIISFAFLQGLFKEQGHYVKYFEENLPDENWYYDLILVYGTVVDFKNENKICKLLKEKFPKAKVGFFGPFPSRNPEIFNSGDFVLLGESESFFMNDFKNLEQLKGNVFVSSLTDMEKLPSPDFTSFPLKKYGYSPAISEKPFLVLQASKGCPYSCRFYCTYGEYQGPKIRQRSAKKVVDDILNLQQKYGVKGIQFRDPVFGLFPKFIDEFCEELKKRNVNIVWGMETRLDLLNENNLKKMFDAGLRNINVGIETSDPEIAKLNKRGLIEENHQEKIIKICKELGIKVSAFYILGYEGDTKETVRNTINYAIKLNTPLARFAISTPYPGTGFYEQLKKEGRILTDDYEKYTQFNLVYRHKNLSQEEVKDLLEEALRKYYFRPSYFLSMLKLKIKWLF